MKSGVAVTENDTPGFGNYDTYTLEDVLLERARELCFERWRWYDLARTGMLEHFLENRNGFSTTKTSFDSDKNYLFPIPLSEIQISTNKDGMYQNPNY
ncbi:RagB/SusD family nutrient uptake outer membrane protein [Bacteroides sp. CR5/BHMF/2]|nr:RagB/SusD family nutrient uptake outer membrane protein [Bacteroides sp. CR5/BHMF/2]